MNSKLKQQLVSSACTLVGAGLVTSTQHYTKIENVCNLLVQSVVEDMFLAVHWNFALSKIENIEGKANEFTEVKISTDVNDENGNPIKVSITDCLKVSVITPSSIDWYIHQKKLYFRGTKLEMAFYFSENILKNLDENVSGSFQAICSMNLAHQCTSSINSDSSFAEGLRAQYMRKLEEVRRIHANELSVLNSGKF